jgi:EpsI family protein
LDTTGFVLQFQRLASIAPGRGLVIAALMSLAIGVAYTFTPERAAQTLSRESFSSFPRNFGSWSGAMQVLDPEVERVLAASDYVNATYIAPGETSYVNIFSAWYEKQTDGSGIHSPEVCLPVGGWEIFSLEPHSVSLPDTPYGTFQVNRAVIQKGFSKQLVYYWFEQRGKRMTNDYAAKVSVIWDSLTIGRSDGAIVRFVTAIEPGETEDDAENRMLRLMDLSLKRMPKYIPQ